jgi:GTPase
MNDNIINLFGATTIGSGVEKPTVDANDANLKSGGSENHEQVADPLVVYEDIMTEEYEKNDTRIAMIGNVDSGKSTLIGILTNATLDDGRGAARSMVLKHRHEQENGRTSAVTVEIIGYKGNHQ